jgi:DNA-directed RNA polymerase subunit RPC12/RpoP
MKNEPQSPAKLEAVHVCDECGSRFRPEQLSAEVNITGVIECKVCSHIGPLRILILPQKPELTDKS